MNNENLMRLTSEEAREFGARGGRVISVKKKYAAQLRALKKRVNSGQLKTKDEEWLLARLTDPDMSAMQIVSLLDEVKELPIDNEMKIKLSNAYSNAHKLIYGQKITSENVNINININSEIETAHTLIKDRVRT